MEVGGAELIGGWFCEIVMAMGYGLSKKRKAWGFVEMRAIAGQFL